MNLLFKVRGLAATTFFLLVISVITLVQTFIDEESRTLYIVSTVIAHACLLAAGFYCAKAIARHQNDNMFASLRNDLHKED